MADTLMIAQVSIPTDTGLPEDYCTNTWHFDADSVVDSQDAYDAVMTMLNDFYHTIDNTLLSANCGTDAIVKIYDIRDTPPRAPVRTEGITLTPAATTGFPNEVCIALSYQAEQVSGLPQARRRGRIFIGPLTSAAGQDAAGDFQVTDAAADLLGGAATAMVAGVDVGGGHVQWAVYSPTTKAGGATYDDSFHDVTDGWVDNAFDIQRRRGSAATNRTLWT